MKRGERRHETNKKATKRWNYFHKRTHLQFPWVDLTKMPAVGIYKKSKGCECRGCTKMKWMVKYQTDTKQRKESVLEE